MKIALIGPVYPYKGGISHYTGLLAKSLQAKHDVYMISFSMQYPKLLYKGRQRVFDDDTLAVSNAKFILDTVNPLTWVKTIKEIVNYSPELIIFQWWHPYFTPCFLWLVRKLKKDFKILFLCHNVFPHESFPLSRLLTKCVLFNGDAFIVHSEQDAQDLQSIVSAPLYKKTFHPTYETFNKRNLSKFQARQELAIDQKRKILLFFGFVREYKGLKYLLQAMPKVRGEFEEVLLLVVGDFGTTKQYYLDLISNEKIENMVKIIDDYVADDEVELYFSASDLVVLPYTSTTQSGVAQLAYGFLKPVIVTNVGGLPETVTDGQTGYIVPPKDPKALSDAIIKFFSHPFPDRFTSYIQKMSYHYSWTRLTEVIDELWRKLR